MATTSTGFLRTPGELTTPPEARLNGTQHGGVAIFVTRITLEASDSDSAKALLFCSQLQGVGLKTNESAIRVLNCSDSDTGQTDHQAIVIVKPTGPEEEQLTSLCVDPALGTEIIFSLACGAIPPARQGLSRRAVASRLPFDGALADTIGVFMGIILQSKAVLAQRMPILQAGLRQMALEATHLAMDEQNAILNQQRAVVDAGAESLSQDIVTRAARSVAHSAEVVACLQLISTEPERHYGIFLTRLNWKSGRAFCITSNTGIPMGQERNRTIASMMRECYTAFVVRVFSCATAPAQTHYETMAFARSCTDMHLNRDHLPKTMTDRLQCTALGHPMKVSEPTAAAHAAVTPRGAPALLVPKPKGGWRLVIDFRELNKHIPHDVYEPPSCDL